MKTSMGEMQKALKEAREDKEAALSHVQKRMERQSRRANVEI